MTNRIKSIHPLANLLSPLSTHVSLFLQHQGRYMIAAIGEKEYFTSRATSTVPAALIAHIPLVTRYTTPTTL